MDGRLLPVDTIGPGKAIREQAMAELKGSQVEGIKVVKPGDVAARQQYGTAAQFGVVEITLLPQFRKGW